MLTTVKCSLCDVQMSPWCQGRCTHAKAAITPPKAEKKAKTIPPPKNTPQGGKTPVPVYCLTTSVWYESAAEAALAVRTNLTNIHMACTGEIQKAAGMQWMKADNPNLPEEAKPRIKYKKKAERRVKIIQTGAEYKNISEAAKVLKIGTKTAYTYIGKSYKGKRVLEYIMTEEIK